MGRGSAGDLRPIERIYAPLAGPPRGPRGGRGAARHPDVRAGGGAHRAAPARDGTRGRHYRALVAWPDERAQRLVRWQRGGWTLAAVDLTTRRSPSPAPKACDAVRGVVNRPSTAPCYGGRGARWRAASGDAVPSAAAPRWACESSSRVPALIRPRSSGAAWRLAPILHPLSSSRPTDHPRTVRGTTISATPPDRPTHTTGADTRAPRPRTPPADTERFWSLAVATQLIEEHWPTCTAAPPGRRARPTRAGGGGPVAPGRCCGPWCWPCWGADTPPPSPNPTLNLIRHPLLAHVSVRQRRAHSPPVMPSTSTRPSPAPATPGHRRPIPSCA
jgi:hypothetical protein